MTTTATHETWPAELTSAGLATLGARNACDREPIAHCGAIQPQGLLLALDPATLRVEAVSANLARWRDRPAQSALGDTLAAALGADLSDLLGPPGTPPRCEEGQPTALSLPAPDGSGLAHYELLMHRAEPWLVLELEPAFALSDQGLTGFYQTLGRTMDRLHEVDEVDALCQLAVRELHALTGYDRVMVYRFDDDAHGQVIAETRAPDQPPYLGLHYPAGDIPRQARILYFRNRVRVIADVDYQPVPLLVTARLADPSALDLSLAVLRSVSPVHLEYLRNMRVAATLTVSLVIDGRLWGLLACHHRTPKQVSARVRQACEMIGQLLALQVRAAQARQDHAYEARLTRLVTQTLAAMAAGESIPAGAAAAPEALLGMLGADGAVLQVGGERVHCGTVPLAATLDRLLPHLAALAETQAPPVVTAALRTLPTDGSAADLLTDRDLLRLAAGVVYLPVGYRGRDFILWVRREQAATVRWAGAVDPDGCRPEPPADTADLGPGHSFAEWRETVHGRCRPWHHAELAAARELAQALPGLLLHRARHRLLRLAMHDPLTGLPNRALLLERLREAQLRAAPIAVIAMDLDGFKEINDTYGHQAGDALLVETALRLQTAVRPGDTVARLGGDEFIVLLEDLADAGQAIRVAERIVAALKNPVSLSPRQRHRITASLGLTVPQEPADAVEILHQADTALHHAKRGGRDRISAYTADWSVLGSARTPLEAELRRGLEQGELVVHYQPVFELLPPAAGAADGGPYGAHRLRGAEALVRWQHPGRGLVAPEHFIPTAEETGLIDGVWDFVLGETLRQLRAWPAPDLQAAVNVAACQLAHPDFARRVLERLARAGLAPARLCIEVTETQVMEHPERAIAVLAELAAAGVAVAIDDFGVGYSSLAQARNLPAGILKIDRSFVAGLPCNPRDLAVVSSTVRLAHELGMIAIGEGVETLAQLECLRALGCDCVQGFLLGRPLGPQDLAAAPWACPSTPGPAPT